MPAEDAAFARVTDDDVVPGSIMDRLTPEDAGSEASIESVLEPATPEAAPAGTAAGAPPVTGSPVVPGEPAPAPAVGHPASTAPPAGTPSTPPAGTPTAPPAGTPSASTPPAAMPGPAPAAGPPANSVDPDAPAPGSPAGAPVGSGEPVPDSSVDVPVGSGEQVPDSPADVPVGSGEQVPGSPADVPGDSDGSAPDPSAGAPEKPDDPSAEPDSPAEGSGDPDDQPGSDPSAGEGEPDDDTPYPETREPATTTAPATKQDGWQVDSYQLRSFTGAVERARSYLEAVRAKVDRMQGAEMTPQLGTSPVGRQLAKKFDDRLNSTDGLRVMLTEAMKRMEEFVTSAEKAAQSYDELDESTADTFTNIEPPVVKQG